MKEPSLEQTFKQTVFREVSSVMAALAEPARLELLELLCQRERGVEELASLVGSRVNTVSHHLQILADRKLARRRKVGRSVQYEASRMGLQLWSEVSRITSAELSDIKVAIRELAESTDAAEELDHKELLARMSRNEVVLVDVRPREEFEAGHVPGAISMPMETLREQIDSLPTGREVVAYCRGRYCVLSYEAVRELRSRGYNAVRSADGVAEWRSSERTISQEGNHEDTVHT